MLYFCFLLNSVSFGIVLLIIFTTCCNLLVNSLLPLGSNNFREMYIYQSRSSPGLHHQPKLIPGPGQGPDQNLLSFIDVDGNLPLTHLHVAIQDLLDLDHRSDPAITLSMRMNGDHTRIVGITEVGGI